MKGGMRGEGGGHEGGGRHEEGRGHEFLTTEYIGLMNTRYLDLAGGYFQDWKIVEAVCD